MKAELKYFKKGALSALALYEFMHDNVNFAESTKIDTQE